MNTTEQSERPSGVGLFYLGAVLGTGISATTSWLYFRDDLHITNWRERAAMFAVLEVVLVACGWATRANVRRPGGTPGPPRTLAWILCGLGAYMAVAVSGPAAGLIRVALGPVTALVCLHMALGIEVRTKHGEDAGTWGKIRAEVKERALSRLGLGDDQRDALMRTRDRARDRAARLATAGGWVPRRQARLAKAVRASGAGLDDQQRADLVEQVATLRHVSHLTSAPLPSPWTAHGVIAEQLPPHLTEVITGAIADALGEHRSEHLTEDRGEDVTQVVTRVVTEHLTGVRTQLLTEDLTPVLSEHLTEVLTGPLSEDLTQVITGVVTEVLNERAEESSPRSSSRSAPQANDTSARIAKLRRRRPTWTQKQVAVDLGMSAATVQRYWALTTPEPAVDQHKANGTEPLTTLTGHPATP